MQLTPLYSYLYHVYYNNQLAKELCKCSFNIYLFYQIYTPSNLKGGVIIDGYTPEGALNYSDTVQLGKTVILVCRVSGIPYGVQTSYRWTCPNGTYNIGGGRNPNRKTYNDTLIINILSATDGGEYTCEVTTDSCDIIETKYRLNVQVKGIIIINIKICIYELYTYNTVYTYIHTMCVPCI